MTNRQWLESLSDEELTKFLHSTGEFLTSLPYHHLKIWLQSEHTEASK